MTAAGAQASGQQQEPAQLRQSQLDQESPSFMEERMSIFAWFQRHFTTSDGHWPYSRTMYSLRLMPCPASTFCTFAILKSKRLYLPVTEATSFFQNRFKSQKIIYSYKDQHLEDNCHSGHMFKISYPDPVST